MFHIGSFALRMLGLLGTAALVTLLVTNGPEAPMPMQWRQAIDEAARPLLHKEATSCGIVAIDDESSSARACLESAQRTRAHFWVLSQGRGEDSKLWLLIVGAPDGTLRSVVFDSYNWQARGRPSFVATHCPCPAVRVADANSRREFGLPAFDCLAR